MNIRVCKREREREREGVGLCCVVWFTRSQALLAVAIFCPAAGTDSCGTLLSHEYGKARRERKEKAIIRALERLSMDCVELMMVI